MEVTGLLELAGFGLVKFFGYRLFLSTIKVEGNTSSTNIVACVRLVAGVLVGSLIYVAFDQGDSFLPVYLSAIFAGRLTIWYIVIGYYYRSLTMQRRLKLTVGATLVSYVLDLPSSAGLWFIIGGIC